MQKKNCTIYTTYSSVYEQKSAEDMASAVDVVIHIEEEERFSTDCARFVVSGVHTVACGVPWMSQWSKTSLNVEDILVSMEKASDWKTRALLKAVNRVNLKSHLSACTDRWLAWAKS